MNKNSEQLISKALRNDRIGEPDKGCRRSPDVCIFIEE